MEEIGTWSLIAGVQVLPRKDEPENSGEGNLQIKRFFNLDTQAYNDGALPRKVKELMGLVASLVLRCDDCITYHIIQCVEQKVSDAEFFEVFNIGLVVGGSITIPHLRSAVEMLEECRRKEKRA